MGRLKGSAKRKARAKKSKREKNKAKYEGAVYRKQMLSEIRLFNAPILKVKCEEVGPNEDVSAIITQLKRTLIASKNGVGLAAPQIGHTKRIIAVRPLGWNSSVTVLVNPVIETYSDEKITAMEGCLSYPEFYTLVNRAKEIEVRYIDQEKKKVVKAHKDLKARIIQHECDHLDGICFVGDKWVALNAEIGLIGEKCITGKELITKVERKKEKERQRKQTTVVDVPEGQYIAKAEAEKTDES